MAVVHAGDDQHACPGAHHGGHDTWPRVQLLALEAPGDGDRHVPMGDGAC